MKILLFTDLPPSENYPGGLVLNQVVRFLPHGSVACFAVVNWHLIVQLPDDMTWMPAYFVDKPQEHGMRHTAPSAPFPDQIGALKGLYDQHVRGKRILKEAVAYGREQQVDRVVAVLQGQTIINLAEPLARALGVPLYSLVWDPLVWWVKHSALDPLTARTVFRNFNRAMKASRAVAVASRAMAEAYSRQYGAPATPVIRSHEAAHARAPEPAMRADGELVIGFAGQVYAEEEFRQLIQALNAVSWTIRGRKVRLRVFGRDFPGFGVAEDQIEIMGWHAEEALIDGLSTCDVLYCPYPFNPELEEVSRLSFPSKLVAYLAAGRPVILHGPKDSPPAAYVEAKGVGVVAPYRNASSIYNAVDRLARDPDMYRRAALATQAAFHADFTLERMKASVFDWLGVTQADLPPDSDIKIAALRDERRWRGEEHKPLPTPNPVWLFLRNLTTGGGPVRMLQTALSPVRQTLDLNTGWELRKHPLKAPPGAHYEEFSSGLQPWDYVAGLKLEPRRASGRYLSLSVTALAEDSFVILVDKAWNQVGDRIRIPAGQWWFNVWFDLDKTPGAWCLVFQAPAMPRRASVKVHGATIYSPWKSLLERVLRQA